MWRPKSTARCADPRGDGAIVTRSLCGGLTRTADVPAQVRGEYEKVPTLSPATLTEANGEEMLPLDETAKPTAVGMNGREKGERLSE